MCAYNGDDNTCYGNQITNSVAAGCVYAGFVVPGHDCDDNYSYKFRDNVAHSIEGIGAVIFPDVTGGSHRFCYEGSRFKAYKCQEQSVATHFKSEEIRIKEVTQIDCQHGISIQTSGENEK